MCGLSTYWGRCKSLLESLKHPKLTGIYQNQHNMKIAAKSPRNIYQLV
ncbi:hypothetical protein LINPERPRIM_LOCUS20603 [Linum perenne]